MVTLKHTNIETFIIRVEMHSIIKIIVLINGIKGRLIIDQVVDAVQHYICLD